MPSTRLTATLCAASTLLFVSPALAQPAPEPIEYHFDDDAMVGGTLSANLALLKVRARPPRVTLIRPRASFVAELVTSVEKL